MPCKIYKQRSRLPPDKQFYNNLTKKKYYLNYGIIFLINIRTFWKLKTVPYGKLPNKYYEVNKSLN